MKAEALEAHCGGGPVQGPLLISPTIFCDERGFFYESWNQALWIDLLASHNQTAQPFVQDNHSRSSHGVLRGLHWQRPPHPQAKLVRCVVGEIFDVAVDLRLNSPSYGQWVAARISAANQQQLWIPVGFAHGFLTLSDYAEVIYKTSDYWFRDCERGLAWNDPRLGIRWPQDGWATELPLLSEKDSLAPTLAELEANKEVFE